MPSQPTLRPFDVAVALRLLLVPEERYEPLAAALATSTSAVHRSVARLQHAGLCRAGGRTIIQPAFKDFLVSGVRYVFPAVHGPERSGMATAGAHPTLITLLGADVMRPLVWPVEGGTSRGEMLVPLFTGVTKVASRDAQLHELLASVDVLRVGTPVQRARVTDFLQSRVLPMA